MGLAPGRSGRMMLRVAMTWLAAQGTDGRTPPSHTTWSHTAHHGSNIALSTHPTPCATTRPAIPASARAGSSEQERRRPRHGAWPGTVRALAHTGSRNTCAMRIGSATCTSVVGTGSGGRTRSGSSATPAALLPPPAPALMTTCAGLPCRAERMAWGPRVHCHVPTCVPLDRTPPCLQFSDGPRE